MFHVRSTKISNVNLLNISTYLAKKTNVRHREIIHVFLSSLTYIRLCHSVYLFGSIIASVRPVTVNWRTDIL
jgi:hypothetical protein